MSKDGFFAAPRDAKAVSIQFTNAAEEQVIDLISSFDDCSADSPEVDSAQGVGDYINNRTAQFLHALDLSQVENALELSRDFGNLSRLLGEKLDSVESLKPSANIAKASAYRCADLPNVGTICGSLQDVQLPTAYYDLIVVTDIEHLVDDRSQLQNTVKKLKNCLSKGGVLALITANPPTGQCMVQ